MCDRHGPMRNLELQITVRLELELDTSDTAARVEM